MLNEATARRVCPLATLPWPCVTLRKKKGPVVLSVDGAFAMEDHEKVSDKFFDSKEKTMSPRVFLAVQ